MAVDLQPRARLRNLLLFIVLATIPCYCAGLAAVLLAPDLNATPTPTLVPSWTPAVYPTYTPLPTYTAYPTFPYTASPALSPTITGTLLPRPHHHPHADCYQYPLPATRGDRHPHPQPNAYSVPFAHQHTDRSSNRDAHNHRRPDYRPQPIASHLPQFIGNC